ncbi:conserved Plasmodium protein, unknown function [Plasmodium knowlesi strain H]|uniref:Small exported membrane protein 1 n=3 Tax=Plasmodium knowlesi TaxID=5850 RepID=A0A5K1UPG7_PLAKH|nr:small exported membrane protein 1, putative [Plasmodium knowlesi strain H]OTN68690.1 Uncharacterized protein PKNOH_S01008900 [Plasmodium knowlesi]CAA9986092.1 small exported membrane protein 1, putative [Plasmodium knowlesi strain H]SBO25244.1 conserved Plasmodium protein, unknown function [Plasmodium knowlesi strain H]SBO27588.1 conserved Plasmodium protein, unknown function [Plasmodium knowlesi strain H]VVS75566.1 small exported membrane protein 1, putative [Plasmodium knowlesi strain H]|eukprot:XP_002257502.1 hypothetical protein, conserved in Plasmodium species [Plasmodium knowlesi strain H]
MYQQRNFDKGDPTSTHQRQFEESDDGIPGYGIPPNPTMINLTGNQDSRSNLMQQFGINNKTVSQFLVNMFVYVAAILISLKIWDYMSYSKCDYYKDLLLRIVRYQSHMNDVKMA